MSSHISQMALVSSSEGIVPGSSNSAGSVVPRSARRLSKRPSQRRKSKRNSKIRHSSSEDDCLALEEGDFDADSDSLDAEDEEKSILLDTLAELMGNEFLSDVHFIVGQQRDGRGQRIPAHRFMLSARSAVFEKMLYGPMKEGKANIDIEVPDMEPEAFLTMLKFVYTAKADLTPETAMGTLYAANKYGLDGLRIACVKYLKKSLNTRNACMLFSQALLFDEQELAGQCQELIETNAKETLSSAGFRELPVGCIQAIISSDKLRAKEIDIFRACVRWSEYECDRRQLERTFENKRKALSDIIGLIRFPLISSAEVAEEVVATGVLSAEELVQLFSYLCAKPGKQPKIPFSCKPRIRFLVIGTDWACEVKDLISSHSSVAADALNPNLDQLTLGQCAQYDAVLVFSSSAFAEPDELGDILADYVDQGGGVVVAAIAGDCDNHGVAGRYDREDYHALRRGERSHDTRHTLGRRLVPDHPILSHVSSFDGGPQSWRVRTTGLTAGAKLIAEWEDGVPLVAERLVKGRACSVSLNIWPPSRNISKDGWETFTDGDRLIINSLMYVAQA